MKRTIIRIGNVADIGRGSSPRPITDKRYFENGEIPWIKIADATASGKYIYKTKEYVNDVGASYSRKMKPGTLILSASVVSLGIPHFLGVEGCIHDGWIYMDNIHDIDKQYLYYLLLTMRTYFDNLSYGAAIQNINTTILSKTKIEVPSIQSQEKIGLMLSAYDNLIENNNKRIKLLEQMAENLYKEWFVRFRFPGYEGVQFKNSSLGKIPSTFDIVKIGKVIEYYIGGGWGEEELSEHFPKEAYVVRGTDFPNVKYGILDSCPLRYHKLSNYEKRAFKVNDIAFEVSGGTQKQPVGRSVLITERQLKRFNNRLICASFCKLIRCNAEKVSPRYFYHWLQYLHETKVIEQYQLQSTGIINFKFEYFLRKCSFLIPPKDIMEKFEKSVEPIYDEIDILAEQNSKLITQRYMLLPRLMSGKLEV